MGRNLKEVEAMQARLTALAAEGRPHLPSGYCNSRQFFSTLIALCISPLTYGLQDAMKERLMKAYFTDSLAVSDERCCLSSWR